MSGRKLMDPPTFATAGIALWIIAQCKPPYPAKDAFVKVEIIQGGLLNNTPKKYQAAHCRFCLEHHENNAGDEKDWFYGSCHVIAQRGSLPFKCPLGDICKTYLAWSGKGGSQMWFVLSFAQLPNPQITWTEKMPNLGKAGYRSLAECQESQILGAKTKHSGSENRMGSCYSIS